MRVPPADLRFVFLHWTAGDYEETFPAYHFCIALRDGVRTVIETHPLQANARDLRGGAASYAAHVAGRNSHAIGVAVCGMRDAVPADFGRFPLRDDMLEAACALVARLCATYRIAIDAEHVRTHAEAAVEDGYFGSGTDERWDVARLTADARPLEPADARATGDALRARVRAYADGKRRGAALWGALCAAIAAWALFLWHPWIDWFGRIVGANARVLRHDGVMDTIATPSAGIPVTPPRPRILVLGGGFAGMSTAQALERRLYSADADLTLVSRENFSLFTPMLPEVSSGNLETRHVVTPVRAQLHRTRFMLGDVVSVDLAEKSVLVEHSITRARQTVHYDHLVFALGGVTSTFDLPGVAERVLPLKSLEDAERVRNHVISMLELAAITNDPVERKKLLTFVFVGGGFTGVEAAGEMTDFFKSVLRYYRPLKMDDLDIVLVEGGGKLLPELARGMGEYSARSLVRRGVRVLVNTFVAGADDEGLKLKDGSTIGTRTIVWSAGVKPSPAVQALPLEKRRGAIVVNDDFSVPGNPGIWALGDCASTPDDKGGFVPATAQHAIREGPVLADNIVATLLGRPTKPFRYRSMGMMASLGARQGVASIFDSFVITGFPAWALWRTYYLARLPGLDRQARVAFDWTLGLIFPRDISELRVYSARAHRHAEHDAGIASAEVAGTMTL